MARSDLTEEALAEAFSRGDAGAVVDLFDGASDKDRARVREFVERNFDFGFRRAEEDREREGAICAAMLGASTAQTISQRQFYWRWGDPPIDPELLVRVLSARSERFRTSLSKVVLATDWSSWGFVRPLVLAGLIDRETDMDGYIRTMIVSLAVGRDASVREELLADRSLLDDEVWRIFSTPGVLNQYIGPAWTEAIVELTESGELERSRILDQCLRALATDFRPGELAWFAGLLRALEPTQPELTDRSDAVSGLLGLPDPSVVKLALELVKPLVAERAVSLDQVVEQLVHPLGGTRKNLALGALSMLQRIAKEVDEPGLRDRALEVAATGLAHSRPDVAERSLSVIEKSTRSNPSEAVRQALLSYVDIVSPTLRSRAAELAGVGDHASSDDVVEVIDRIPPAVQPSQTELLSNERRLGAATELEEIVGLFATALESGGSADDLERAIAGALKSPLDLDRSELADLVSPVRKRARQVLEQSWGTQPSRLIAALALAWSERTTAHLAGPRSQEPDDGKPGVLGRLLKRDQLQLPPTPFHFFQGRVIELVAALASGRSVSALAEPTHRSGVLDPDELSQRDEGRALGPFDQRLAALRSGNARGSTYQTGWGIGSSGYGPSYHATFDSDRDLDPLLAAAVRNLNDPRRRTGWMDLRGHLGAGMGLSLVPWSPHVIVGMAVESLVTRRGNQPPNSDPFPAVQLLADSCWPLDGPGSPLLALALTEDTEYQAAAVDAVIAGIDDGRFDSIELAQSVAKILGGVVLTRLSGPCSDIASAGPLHRAHVQQFLLELVALIGLEKPKGLHGPLETLAEVSVGGVRIPDTARTVLETLAKSSSKTGKSAKAVLVSSAAA